MQTHYLIIVMNEKLTGRLPIDLTINIHRSKTHLLMRSTSHHAHVLAHGGAEQSLIAAAQDKDVVASLVGVGDNEISESLGHARTLSTAQSLRSWLNKET